MSRKKMMRMMVAGLLTLFFICFMNPQPTNAEVTTSYQISPGDSAIVTSSYTTSTTIYAKGPSFDYVKYYDDNDVSYYGQEETSDSYTVSSGQRVIVTNTSSGIVTLSTSSRALSMSWTSTPALIKKWLAPGQSMTVVNESDSSESIKVGGENDYADYDEFGTLLSYATEDSGGSMSIPAGEKSAITNRDSVGYEVFGAYEIFSFTDRSTPAAFHWILHPGETMQAISHATKNFYIHFNYTFYEYALYDEVGELDSYGQSTTTSRYVSPLEKLIVTNIDDEIMEVSGPYDGFTVSARSLPALFTKTMQSGDSLRIKNMSDKAYTLNFEGSYDFAEYNASGEEVGYGKDVLTSSNSIAAGGYIIVTEAGSGTTKVVGPYDGFQFTDSLHPALNTRSVAPGESLEAINNTPGVAGIQLGGIFDYALYENPGGIKSYYASKSLSEFHVLAAERIAFTNVGSSSEEIYAPYEAITFASRSNPVTFHDTLAPGETVKADNSALHSFNIAVSDQHHYVIYDNGNEVSSFGHPVEAGSYFIEDTESLVITNSGQVSVTVSGPYDAFQVSNQTSPALHKVYLSNGSSLRLTNLGPKTFSLDLEGTYDQASYMVGGELRSFDHNRTLGSLSLYSGERITLTSTGSAPLQVLTPYDVTQIQTSVTPALALKTLIPGQSVVFRNIAAQAENIEMSGIHDMMEFDAAGSPDVYAKDRALTYKSVSAGISVAFENSDSKSIEIYGAYEIFSAVDRSDPVTFKRTLSAEQSLELKNRTGKLFSIYTEGLYDYAQYDGTGDATDADREYPSGSKSVASGNRLAVTAAGSTVLVEGPFDVFTILNRTNPALFERTLSPRQSIEAVYMGATEGDVHMTGEYDFALYASGGTVDTYARNQSISSYRSINAGQRIAVENSDEAAIVVYGAFDLFQVSSRTNPVTFHKTLAPGESMEAVNHTVKQFYLYMTGLNDYVQYNSTGAVQQIERANISGTRSMSAGSRIQITNADASAITVEGAFDVYAVVNRANPALFVSILQPGANMEAAYTGNLNADVKMTGIYDFALYDGSGSFEQYGHHYETLSTQNVAAGKKIAIQNSDEVPIEVYGAYDLFETHARVNPVTFTRMLTSNETVEFHTSTAKQLYLYFDGAYDYARYSSDGGVKYFDTWNISGSQMLQGDDKFVVSPAEAQTVTVSGAFDGFTLINRNQRAVTIKNLQLGESYSFRNISPDSFFIRIDGIYDYQFYDLFGNIENFGNDSTLSSRSIGSTKRIEITNADTVPITVAVPTDAIKETDGNDPDEFVKGLEFGESIEAVNTTNETATLIVSGKYDMAVYSASGNPVSFARETSSASIFVPAGYRAVVTGREASGTVVSGSQSAFQIAEQIEPALNIIKPGQGNTVEIKNISAGTWSLSIDGKTNWVSYNGSGALLDYVLEDDISLFTMSASQKLVVTQPFLDGLALWGPYDAMQTQTIEHPALVQTDLAEEAVLKALNLAGADRTLKVEGLFTYRIGEGAELNGQSPLSVPIGATVYIRNVGMAEYQVYAPFGSFQFEIDRTGTGPISGIGAAEQIAKLDPADYDPQSFHSDPIDTASGAQIINRTLLTAHGAVPIPFQAQYHSLLAGEGALGTNWSHNYEIRLTSDLGGDIVKVYWNDFRSNTFVRDSNGTFTSADQATKLDNLVENVDGTYELRRNDGTVYHFSETGILTSLAEKTGLQLMFGYSSDGRLMTVTEPLTGAMLSFGYNAGGNVSTVSDQAGRQIVINYDAAGMLTELTDAAGRNDVYAYDAAGRIVSASSGGVQWFENVFDSEGRVVKQHDAVAGSNPTQFDYTETDGQLVTTITDRNGNVQKRTHDANYQLLSVQDELGHTTAYTYDEDGNRVSVTNALNQTTIYTYDERGNRISAIDHTGKTMQMTYDAANNLLTVTGPDGGQVVNTYDSSHRLLTVTDPENGTTAYAYDSNGLLLSATDPLGGITDYAYTGNRLTRMQNAEEETVIFGYDDAGRLISETDADGNKTTFAYNDDDQLLSETDPLGHTVSYTYDDQGLLASETDARGNATSYAYDGNGNVTGVTNALNETTNFAYDGEGRLIEATDPLGHSVTYAYDAAGNLLMETNAEGETARYVYDALSRLVEVYDAKNIKVYSAKYDSAGNLVMLTDALNHTRTNEYDDLNRLKGSIDPLLRTTSFSYDNLYRLTLVADPLEGQASRSFDALGRITSVTDPNTNTTVYTYDLLGRLIGETDAAGGNHAYQYNALGLLAQETNGRNQATVYTYDDAGRLDQFTDPVGTVTYTYDASGNVTAITDENGKTLTRVFDELNRVERYTDEDGHTIQYDYDAAGNLSSMTYPDGKMVTYTYDDANRLKTVTDWDNRVTTYDYDLNGRLFLTQRPDGSAEIRMYDENGQLTSISDKRADGSVIYEADYLYDAVGNVVTETPTVTSSVYESGMVFDINGPGLSPNTEILSSGDVTMTYTADNRLLTYNGSTVLYDADGNMTLGPLQGTLQPYTYDARNRLMEAGGASYGYNSENARTSITVNGVTTKYVINPHAIMSQVLMELDGQGQTQAWYVYGLGLIGREDAAGNYQTYHYDRRGSTVALTDEAGQVTDLYTYGNYGELLDHQGATDQPFGYNGRDGVMTDPNGLYYMRARYYNPDIKRFVNRDVITGSIAAGQTLNRYAYVNGNPISYVDPFGLSRDGDSIWVQGGNFLADFTPWVGTVKGFQQAFTGMNYISGERLTVSDRWAEGIGSTFSLIPIPGLKYVGKYGTEGAIQAGKGIRRWFGAGAEGMSKVQTGGRNDLSVDEYFRHEAEADKMYDSIRASSDDIKKIAQNAGMRESRVHRIKEHVFFKEHIKSSGYGRFHSDYEIAQAWTRLQNGTHTTKDIDLLNHELFESRFEGIFKTNYEAAHDAAVRSGRPWEID